MKLTNLEIEYNKDEECEWIEWQLEVMDASLRPSSAIRPLIKSKDQDDYMIQFRRSAADRYLGHDDIHLFL